MNAYLLLANGMVFAGQSVGAEGVTVGEVVFATGMVGFEETLTDPSYYGQIITQTYPLIGNYGMNKDDMESDRIWAKGYIVREACTTPSNWRCEETLDSFLKKNNTIGIEGIDTRHLTRIIRESGVMNGAMLTTFDPADPANKDKTDALLPVGEQVKTEHFVEGDMIRVYVIEVRRSSRGPQVMVSRTHPALVKRLFELDGVKLSFDEAVLDYIVDKAVEFKLGARGLRSICEAIMMDTMFDIPSTDVRKFTVTLPYAKKKIEKANILELKQVG